MLTAVDADPRTCGYSDDQIERCLKALTVQGVSQERACARQTLLMLAEKGAIESAEPIRPHPEVLKVRIHPKNSPLEGMPVDLRRPLLSIYLAHATGAVRWEKGRWIDFDPMTAPGMQAPFAFELAGGAGQPDATGGVLWGELTWPEAERRLQQVDIALLPVGAVEQHGPHLPMDTDAFDADYLAKRVAEACSEPRPLVLPPIDYGVSYHHQDFPGTLSVSNDTLARMVYDIGMSAASQGIRKLVIINGHGGNAPALNFAAQMINRDARIFVCVDSGETSDVDIYGLVETPNDVHAGEIETSTSLAVRPHLVRMDRAMPAVPEFSSRYLDFTSKRGISWYAYTRRISSTGVMGDPTRGSAEKGEKIWAIMIAHLTAFVEDLKGMSLEEIHQRRY
jgi:creatinine amidohydrolase/Fe(II)-dependent formamide hydrolase-like protein